MKCCVVDGILLLDKPAGISSNAALQEARRLLAAAKAGHAGTLDPLASGLLPLLFGEATRFARFGLDSDKSYLASVRLGVRTATGDAEGEVLERRVVTLDDAQVAAALARFRGEITQVPPMYSALKREGRPLYELARAGKSIEREARQVTIHHLSLLERNEDLLRLCVRCSKGTYIRQLAADLGAVLGTGAHLEALRRSGSGAFTIAEAVSLERFRAMDEAGRQACLRPTDSMLAMLPVARLGEEEALRLTQGQAVPAAMEPARACRVLGHDGALLGVGEVGLDRRLRPLRLLSQRARRGATG
ncbi:MAG: tRNA pseudouridine(55) synthase TruB [Betaproteobacteria bacterium]|nr:tRNA pseudouridine(55) synthase TruB [Betaproteobacteria bacterium]MBM3384682.1 tRNA pseudouridine(55) synthase TruB [Betaproteobacteria bacterium]